MSGNRICACTKSDVCQSPFGPFCLGCGCNLVSEKQPPASSISDVLNDGYEDEEDEDYDDIRPSIGVSAALQLTQDCEPDTDSEDSAIFNHKPLRLRSDIRLIILQPSRTYEDEIQCRIVHGKVVDCDGAYEALSYTWGDQTRCEAIRCNGTRTLKVTQNCADALRDLRHPMHERVLWIDAVCIDQSNILERNHQVSLMRDIYSRARQVVIYTGKEYNPKRQYLEILRSQKPKHMSEEERIEFQDDIRIFLSRNWFRRVWILQEVAMAREAVFLFTGGETIGWNSLSIARLNILGVAAVDEFGNVPPVLQLAHAEHKPLKDASSLLVMAIRTEASDPRDKVYALLGLLDNANDIGISVDYGKSVQDVFREFAVLMIKTFNHLDILMYVKMQSSFQTNNGEEDIIYDDRATSWVPKLNELPREISLARWRGQAAIPYAADPVATFSCLADGPERPLALHVQVLPLDRMDVIELPAGFHRWDTANIPKQFNGKMPWEGLDDVIFIEVEEPWMEDTVFESRKARAEILLRGILCYNADNYGCGDLFKGAWDSLEELDSFALVHYSTHNLKKLEAFSIGRDFRMTTRSFAICPKKTARTDLICVVRGASVPLILRRAGHGCFQLVGECYLEGFRPSWSVVDYGKLLGAYRRCFEKRQSWDVPEFSNMGTIDEEGNLPWTEVSLV